MDTKLNEWRLNCMLKEHHITKKGVMKAFEKDILKPFELVRAILEDKLKGDKESGILQCFP